VSENDDVWVFVGVLLYGPPGTGKTLLARACASQTKSTFLKLAGPQLVQMFIGDGAKLVRDAFALAKEKTPAIIFIDELDAIGNVVVCYSLCFHSVFIVFVLVIDCYPHMPIGKVWICQLLFVCNFVCVYGHVPSPRYQSIYGL